MVFLLRSSPFFRLRDNASHMIRRAGGYFHLHHYRLLKRAGGFLNLHAFAEFSFLRKRLGGLLTFRIGGSLILFANFVRYLGLRQGGVFNLSH